MKVSTDRPTEEVFKDHVRLRLEGRLEDDLQRNYSENVALPTVNSNEEGHDVLRLSAARLEEQLPDAGVEVVKMQVQGRYALLIWSATSPRMDAVEGSDSFVIEDGKIVFQSIHDGLRERSNA